MPSPLRHPAALQGLAVLIALGLVIGPLGPLLWAVLRGDAITQLSEPRVALVFWRSVWMAALSAGLAVAVGLPLAILAYRTRIWGAELLAMLMPLTLLLPPLLMAQGWNGLTGWDGLWASVFVLGMCYAPLPALLASRALRTQSAAAHETALMLGGRKLALREMVRTARPAVILGASLAFLFAITDFAVPDYMAALGETFGVYPGHVYTHFRDDDYWSGARAAAPLVLLCGLVLYLGLWARDHWGAEEVGSERQAQSMDWGRQTALTSLIGWSLLSLTLLAPLVRIVYELGVAGPEAPGTWSTRASESVQAALDRGREDIGRSFRNGAMAGGLALLLAPALAHLLVRTKGWCGRSIMTLTALPLLAPGVGYGMGAISFANRPGWSNFYQGTGLVVLVFAGRFLPIAVFLLAERFRSVPRSRDDAAVLHGLSYPRRLIQVFVAPQASAWLLAATLVVVFAVRELDLAILLPGANQSAAVRYFNALHFARDGFVAAFGLLIAILLFLPVMAYAAWTSLCRRDD
ncbi:MAG: hypothetical protein MK209_05700 [Planctomycetes bacterium]|nr:hypothetical protein [Planctomycetota bacterium]